MNTDELEQQAMNKIYNHDMPDELYDPKTLEGKKEGDNYGIVKDILKKHDEIIFRKEEFPPTEFSYISVKDTMWQWHFLKILDNRYGLLLPSNYILEYSSGDKNSKEKGKFFFREDGEYVLEYRNCSFEEFEKQMEDLKEVFTLIEKFTTEENQIFYEYEEDAIYSYQDSYVWRISGYHRNNILEYFQMYLILRSFHYLNNGEYKDNNILKYLYLVEKNAVSYLYKGKDLRKFSKIECFKEFEDSIDVVTISLDNSRYEEVLDLDYSIYKRKKLKEKEELPITIFHRDEWTFEGNFPIGIFGNYLEGELSDFSSIFFSNEFSEPEKKELLLKVVIEKKQECLEKKDYLNSQFLLLFFQKRFDKIQELFEQERWIDFLKVENISVQELSLEMVEAWFLEKLNALKGIPVENLEQSEEWKELFSYIDISSFQSRVKPLYVTLTPLFMILECEVFDQKENYILTEDYQVMEWL